MSIFVRLKAKHLKLQMKKDILSTVRKYFYCYKIKFRESIKIIRYLLTLKSFINNFT